MSGCSTLPVYEALGLLAAGISELREQRPWPEGFRSFTVEHLLIDLVAAVLILGPLWLGVRLRGDGGAGELRLSRILGVGGLLFAAASNSWYLAPGNFKLGESLPLHVCDLAVIIGPLALLTGGRVLCSLCYFWGLALCTQAFVSPVLTDGPANPEFWWFWLGHTVIVGSSLYIVIVKRYRPAWQDCGVAVLWALVYVLLILSFDELAGVNYGYVGSLRPKRPTVIDHLGPWPWRVIWMVLIGALAMSACWFPWKFFDDPRAGKTDGPRPRRPTHETRNPQNR